MLVDEDVHSTQQECVLSVLGTDVHTEADMLLLLMFMIWSVEGVYHLQGLKDSPFCKYSNCTNKHI